MPLHDVPPDLQVNHPLHGPGVVRAWRRGGRAAVVSFARQPLPMEVPTRELERRTAASETREPGRPIIPGPRLEGAIEHGTARLTLEAMRLGVVPSSRLDTYTVGRDFEMALVEADLDAARTHGSVRAFLGDYGVGKTHLLELVQQRALERGFLTARVVLDPEETSPAHPKRVYRAAVRALRYPDRPYEEDVGLAPLLERAANAPEALEAFGLQATAKGQRAASRLQNGHHLYLTPALAYARSLAKCSPQRPPRKVLPHDAEEWVQRARELLFDWLEGHPTISNQVIDRLLNQLPGHHPRIYSLLDYRPWARIYGYLLSGLAALARSSGYEGLVLLIDEAEFYGLLSPENRAFARFLFKAWTWAAVGVDPEGTEQAPREAPLPFSPQELERGGAGIQKRLPARYGSGGLYVVFAMTPHTDGLDALRGAIPPRCITQLGHLEPVDFTELARRVCDFYASAFPDWSFPATLVTPLSKVLLGLIQSGYVSNPRHAMKFVLEFLDIVRYYPEHVPSVVRNLQESLLF